LKPILDHFHPSYMPTHTLTINDKTPTLFPAYLNSAQNIATYPLNLVSIL
jgi:hypothetical protein